MKFNKVTLYIKNIDGLKDFYHQQLGFPMIHEDPDSFSIAVGSDVLSFELAPSTEQNQYHFAFNIPSNLFKEAKEWIQSHTSLLINDGADEVFFESSNMHSLYFYDPEENIVELVARHDINPSIQVETFSAQLILSIGEMNLTTDHIKQVGNQLIELGIPVAKKKTLDEKSLNFMGEAEDGVHILLGPSKRIWYFSDKEAKVSRIQLEINNRLLLKMSPDDLFSYEEIRK